MSYGINPATGRCRQCGKLQVRHATNGMGKLVEVDAPCPCPKVAPPKPKQTREWATTVDRERRRACICQLCDEPVMGKPKVALYCEAHRAEKRAETQARFREKHGDKHQRAYAERNREKLRKRARQRYQRNREERERRNEYKRLWRKLNRDKVRAQKERAALRNFRDPQPGVKRWRAEVEAGVRKPKRARQNQAGERLCVTPYCRQVMQGRAKKCDRCKAKEARAAREKLAEITGRAA
jgi:hypothetical protein